MTMMIAKPQPTAANMNMNMNMMKRPSFGLLRTNDRESVKKRKLNNEMAQLVRKMKIMKLGQGLMGGDDIGELPQNRKRAIEMIMTGFDFDYQNSGSKKRKMIMSSFDFDHQNSGIKKRKTIISKELVKMVCGHCYLPKNKPLGEDAHFMYEEGQIIGVADGVGGWAKEGIDAGEYARQLMSNAKQKAYMDRVMGGATVIEPRNVLNEAFEKNKNLGVQGSSTACIVSLDKETGVMRCVNVGDSGFMVFRYSMLWHKSKTQQHKFNQPYQLGNKCDRPESGVDVKVYLIPGDILVLGTDGLLDNMFPDEIEGFLLEHIANCKHKQGLDCKVLADTIANQAHHNSLDTNYASPFSLHAGKSRMGGKIDDITVIVAHVVAAS